MPRARGWTDDQLRQAVAGSENLLQVCRALGIAAGARTYAQLRRHIDRLGLDRSHLPAVERPRRRRSWTDDDLREAVADNTSVAGVLRTLGYAPSGGMHRYISGCIKRLGCDTAHFTGQGWAKGQARDSSRQTIPLEEILVEESAYMSSASLRRRLVKAGLKDARCERCSLDSWMGEPLPLALDHVNGDHIDNRLENLRILCPNCHALTDTWCARNRSKPA